MADDIRLDAAAVYDLTNGPGGPVARLMAELSEKAATVARARVPVRRTPSWSALSNARPPGFTQASIRTDVRWHQGLVYGGVAAAGDPAYYLEDPREDRREYPFLSAAIDALEL